LIDRYYTGSITAMSDEPQGRTTDGLPVDRERVPLTIGGKIFEIGLVHVTDSQNGPIWLISSSTLAQVPALKRSEEGTWLDSVMPRRLVEATAFGVSIALWLAWAATLIVPFAVFWLLSLV